MQQYQSLLMSPHAALKEQSRLKEEAAQSRDSNTPEES